MYAVCPQCNSKFESVAGDTATCSACGFRFSTKPNSSRPELADSSYDLEETRDLDEASAAKDRVINERYRIVRMLGRGGFGIVYEAYDEALNRSIALKIARSGRFPAEKQKKNIWHEAKVAAKLNHPGIVHIYDIGVDQLTNETFIAMEFVVGTTLLERFATSDISHREAADYVMQAARAVHHAHLAGLVHRDIKLSNILIEKHDRVRVADFGIALHEVHQPKHAGEVLGTPGYMSPEQIRGEAHQLDGRTDIWSLGVVLYELLAGRRPFTSKGLLLADEILNREPKPIRQIKDDVPETLERIALRCLEKPIAARYSTANDLARDLERWLADQRTPDGGPGVNIESEPEPLTSSAARKTWTSRLRGGAIAGVAIALVAAVVLAASGRLNRGLPIWNTGGPVAIGRTFPEPKTRYLLFDRAPKPVILPVGENPQVASYDDSLQSFALQCDAPCGYAIGNVPDRPFRAHIKIDKKGAFHGSSGFFFGFRRDEAAEQEEWTCHTVTLVCFSRGVTDHVMRVERHRLRFQVMGDRMHMIESAVVASETVETIVPPQGVLDVTIKNDRILEVSWNSKLLWKLFDPATIPPLSCDGIMGIFSHFGPTVFSNAQLIND